MRVGDAAERVAALDDVILGRARVVGLRGLLRLGRGRQSRLLLLAHVDLAGELQLLPQADRVVFEVVERLDRVDLHVELLGDLREVVAALDDVEGVVGLGRLLRRGLRLLRGGGFRLLLNDDARAVVRAARAGRGVRCSGRARARRLHLLRLRGRKRLNLVGRRRHCLVVRILASRERRHGGDTQHGHNLIHVLFVLHF